MILDPFIYQTAAICVYFLVIVEGIPVFLLMKDVLVSKMIIFKIWPVL